MYGSRNLLRRRVNRRVYRPYRALRRVSYRTGRRVYRRTR